MESDQDLSSTTTAAGIHPKHAAMLRRLSHRNTTTTTKPSSTDTFESTPSFLSLFNTKKTSIQSSISTLNTKPDISLISDNIASLENSLAHASSFLPSFELQNCLKSIALLKTELVSKSSLIVPKKTFSFRKKKPVSDHVVGDDTRVLEHKDKSLVPELSGFGGLSTGIGSETAVLFGNKEPVSDNVIGNNTRVLEFRRDKSLVPESGFSTGIGSETMFLVRNKEPVLDNVMGHDTRVLEFQKDKSLVPESAGFGGFSTGIGSETPFLFRDKKPVSEQEMGTDRCDLESLKSSGNEVLSKKFSGSEESRKSAFLIPESPGFRDRENEVLFKEFSGLEIGEFVLSGLDSCEVRLKGCVRALFVNKLKNCKVYCGPVSGSVLIEEVEDCVFVLASHQIRIHNAKRCGFYLRVRSRPIIEDCESVRFAPYCLRYDGIERDLEGVNLDEENGNWENVDDFKWLKGFQSPNWSVLPESERIGGVTISDLDK